MRFVRVLGWGNQLAQSNMLSVSHMHLSGWVMCPRHGLMTKRVLHQVTTFLFIFLYLPHHSGTENFPRVSILPSISFRIIFSRHNIFKQFTAGHPTTGQNLWVSPYHFASFTCIPHLNYPIKWGLKRFWNLFEYSKSGKVKNLDLPNGTLLASHQTWIDWLGKHGGNE